VSYPQTVDELRFAGKITGTQYGNMYLQHRGDHWRILATDDCGDCDATGPQYATRAEAYTDLDRVRGVFFAEDDGSGEYDDHCSTEGCTGRMDDGEGYDGYCGNCADRLDAADS
jgi:hypothetical protein